MTMRQGIETGFVWFYEAGITLIQKPDKPDNTKISGQAEISLRKGLYHPLLKTSDNMMNMLAWMKFLLKSSNLLGTKFSGPINQYCKIASI